jgi:hypothetical protein
MYPNKVFKDLGIWKEDINSKEYLLLYAHTQVYM